MPWVAPVPSTMVYPSGAARATKSEPMMPPPPPRFSTMTGWPMLSLIFCASVRASRSVDPPGA